MDRWAHHLINYAGVRVYHEYFGWYSSQTPSRVDLGPVTLKLLNVKAFENHPIHEVVPSVFTEIEVHVISCVLIYNRSGNGDFPLYVLTEY